ncbi:mor transcription activator family protein [Lelliottia amnigena]|uniref:Mor transcription activator family protein n=1 Tax=Lelliottia amnigena TaxID=61646 RepID=UPI00192C6523|nr:Mor transcription activator family protein [Lelliottia amnigena]MBL5922028.1 mor transcription activator family protein [Lelliottia amnigena]
MSTIKDCESQRLPESMHELIRVLGYDAAMRLAEAFGGSSLSGRTGAAKERTGGVHRLIESVLTREEIKRLISWTGGAALYIPRCDAAVRVRRNARFADDYNRLLGEGCSGRSAMAQLCPLYGFSDRYGWEIMRRWRENNAHSGRNT